MVNDVDPKKQSPHFAFPLGMRWVVVWIGLAAGGVVAGWEIGKWQLAESEQAFLAQPAQVQIVAAKAPRLRPR